MALSPTMLALLNNPANHQYMTVLVEINYSGTIYRLSTLPYSSGNYVYDDLIVTDIMLESRLDAPNTVGDFDIVDDHRTDWRTQDFNGRPCTLKIGDTRQAYSTFETLTVQKIQHILIRSESRYTVQFSETDLLLEVPISSPVVNNVSTPQSYGTVYNADPMLVYPADLIYYIGHPFAATSLTVRDNGVTLTAGTGYTVDPSGYAGASGTKFKLLNQPAGQITCDYEIADTKPLYKAVRAILNAAGIYVTDAEVLARMYGFPSGHKTTLYVGLYIREPKNTTAKQALDDLLGQYGCTMRRGEDGLPEIHYLSYDYAYYITPAATIEPDWLLDAEQIGYDDAYSKIELQYQPNQYVQQPDALAGSVTGYLKDLFAKDYRQIITALTNYTGLGSKGTLIKQLGCGESTSAASLELTRLVWRYSTVRRTWRVTVAAGAAIGLREGQCIRITDQLMPTYAYHSDGKFFVSGVKHNYNDFTSELEVIEA